MLFGRRECDLHRETRCSVYTENKRTTDLPRFAVIKRLQVDPVQGLSKSLTEADLEESRNLKEALQLLLTSELIQDLQQTGGKKLAQLNDK